MTFWHILYAREEMPHSHSFLHACSGLRLMKVSFLIGVLLLLVWVFDLAPFVLKHFLGPRFVMSPSNSRQKCFQWQSFFLLL